MCAISGIIGKNLDFNLNKIKKIKKILNHRGPDYSGHIYTKNAILIHNRLSIIDLEKRANQPFESKNKSKILVFNGEIYNFIEIKKELKRLNLRFTTNSDTEVLLMAYEKWGIDCVNKFEGMFAFAIYDLKKKKAFFARDRFGQKPIFFWKKRNKIHFASEIKGLIAAGYSPKPNLSTWFDYLYFGATDHSRDTFFKDIFQLLPGELATYDFNKGFKIKKWYNFKKIIKKFKTKKINNIKNEITKTSYNAVRINSRSDVPISIALSGGLDSSLLMSLSYNKNFLNSKPKCYSIKFENKHSEKEYIDASTKFYNFKSNFINFRQKDFIKSIIPSIWHLESPSGGLMNSAMAKLCHAIKKDKIKVTLDGTGIDEGFGGYELHHLQYLYYLKKNKDPKFVISLKLFMKNWNIKKKAELKKINDLKKLDAKSVDGYKYVNNNILDNKFVSLNKNNIKNFKLDKLSKLDVKNSLCEYIQDTKVPRNCRLLDRVSMAFGVEMRFPFLEHSFLETGLKLDPKAYFLYGRSKSIVRETFKKIIAPKTRKAKKFTIQSPQNDWLRQEPMSSFILRLIKSDKFAQRGIFNKKKVLTAFAKFKKGNSKTSFFIWQVINTEIWFQIFIDKKFDLNKLKFKF